MFVPVVAVGGMKVSVVQIVDVVTMGDCNMTTIWPMLVLVLGVLNTTIDGAFIPMVIVLMM